MESVMFVALCAVVLGLGACVVGAKSPLRSALALIVVQCALAGLYVLMQAPFVAAMQVLVYAGAIMVLFLFVIMLLNVGDEVMPEGSYLAVAKTVGACAMIAVGYWQVCALTTGPMLTAAPMPPSHGSVAHVGAMLLGPYVFAFETVSVLLLTAVVGSIVLNLKRLT